MRSALFGCVPLLPLALVGCGVASTTESARTEPEALTLPGVRNDAFQAASEESKVPRELLMALGWYQGRFEPAPPLDDHRMVHADAEADPAPLAPEDDPALQPELVADPHGVRGAFGMMYLLPDQIERASALTGLDAERIRTEPGANARAAAALLAQHAPSEPQTLTDPQGWRTALDHFLGLEESPEASELAYRELRDVLRAGFDLTTDDGERLAMLGVEGLQTDREALAQLQQALSPGAYPPIQWIPAASSNQSGRNGTPIKFVIVHDIEGTMASAISVFKNPARGASAHYIIRASDGHIVQMVSESNNAWHCGNSYYNRASIGIEHEGFANKPVGGGYYNLTQYRASAQLVCAISKRYNIPVSRSRIFGHGNVPRTGSGALCSDASANAGYCGGKSGHYDPGKYWNWGLFMDLVAKCVSGKNPVTAPSAPPPPAVRYETLSGDFNGDGRDDVATISPNAAGGWSNWLSLELSTGAGLVSKAWTAATPTHMRNGGKTREYRVLTGDFNGDGKTDVATISPDGGGGWANWISMELSTGGGFTSQVWKALTPKHMRNGIATRTYRVLPGDFNGDGKTDLATISQDAVGGWSDWVAIELSTGTGFVSQAWKANTPQHMRNGNPSRRYVVVAGDFNGDKKTDLATVSPDAVGGWANWVSLELSTGGGFTSTVWTTPIPTHMRNGGPTADYRVLTGDFDGNGKTDLAVVSPNAGGAWSKWVAMALSTGTGFFSGTWNATTPQHMRNGGQTRRYYVRAADFDGDGRTDLATLSPDASGGWSNWVAVERSTGAGFASLAWGCSTPQHMRNGGGSADYRVLTGDRDGDGRADLVTLSRTAGGAWSNWAAVNRSWGGGFKSETWNAATPQHMRNGG